MEAQASRDCVFLQKRSRIFQFLSQPPTDKQLAERKRLGYRGGGCAERVSHFPCRLGKVIRYRGGVAHRALEFK